MIKSPSVDGELRPTVPPTVFNPRLSPGNQNMSGSFRLKFPGVEKILDDWPGPGIHPGPYPGRDHYVGTGRGVLSCKLEEKIIGSQTSPHLLIVGDGWVFQDVMQGKNGTFACLHYLAAGYPQNNGDNGQVSNIYQKTPRRDRKSKALH